MRHLLTAALLLIAICPPVLSGGLRREADMRGSVCTAEFNPVCGQVNARAKLRRTFANRCRGACEDR